MTALYTIIGGSVPEVVDKLQTSPAEDCNHLSPANNNKGTSRAEANAALDLHKDFQYHKHTQADQQPETFAKPIGASAQVTDLFTTTGLIKDALVYMILQGDMNKMKALALVPSNNTHGLLQIRSLYTPNTKLDGIVMKRVHEGPYFFFNCRIYFGNPKIYQQMTIMTTTGEQGHKGGGKALQLLWKSWVLKEWQQLKFIGYGI
ncbi:hypothetical protein C8J57DRAFT_1220922 [Mycena rebaudengoi]|nr:hypothetical protein C8J57DRAFT_1220922 [Mycena rebaudengoi]